MIDVTFEHIFDADSFVKTLAFVPGDGQPEGEGGVVTGYGVINNRLVFTAFESGNDISVPHGKKSVEKIIRTLESADARRAPFVLSLGGPSADISDGQAALAAYAKLLGALAPSARRIPVIFVSTGKCIGLHAAVASLCDFVIIPDGSASGASSELLTNIDGKAHNVYRGVDRTFGSAVELKDYLSALIGMLPDSVSSGTPRADFAGEFHSVAAASSGKTGAELILSLADADSFVEIGALSGLETVTGFARFGGFVSGVVAFDGSVHDGRVGPEGIRKLVRFLRFCVRFSVPFVILADFSGIYCSGADDCASVPAELASLSALLSDMRAGCCGSICVVCGKMCGQLAAVLSGFYHNIPGNIVYALEGSAVDAVDPAAGALMKYNSAIRSSADPAAARKEYIAKYYNEHSRPEFAARSGLVDDIIAAEETRDRIIAYLKII